MSHNSNGLAERKHEQLNEHQLAETTYLKAITQKRDSERKSYALSRVTNIRKTRTSKFQASSGCLYNRDESRVKKLKG